MGRICPLRRKPLAGEADNATTCIGVTEGARSALALRFASNASRWLWMLAAVAAVFAAAGLAGWVFYGFPQPLADYLWRLGALSLFAFSVAEYLLAFSCWRLFGSDDPLRRAQLLATLAAGARAAGLILVGLRNGFEIGRDSAARGWAAQAAATGGFGAAFANPLTLVLLAAGLLLVLRPCALAGLLRRPSAFEMAALLIASLFPVGRFVTVLRSSSRLADLPGLVQGISATVYPLMALLLVLVVLLRTPVQEMGDGLVGYRFGVFTAGVFLAPAGATSGRAARHPRNCIPPAIRVAGPRTVVDGESNHEIWSRELARRLPRAQVHADCEPSLEGK